MKWLLLICAAAVCSCHFVSGDDDFDIYTFTQEWPPTFCMSKDCNYPTDIVKGWNIHGLWPSVRSGRDPERCHRGSPFDVRNLKPIISELSIAWANLEAFRDPSEFWSYEWKTHGRCALSNGATSSELKYFNVSLTLKKALNLEKSLALHHIFPDASKVYSTDDIYQALKQVYGVQTVLRCSYHDGQAYLSEMRVCFDKQLTKVDCPVNYVHDFLFRRFGKKVGTNTCPDGVIFPTTADDMRKAKMTMTIV